MNRETAVNQLKETYNILAKDLDEIVAYGKDNNSDFAQRTLVRTHFALIEGMSYQLRQVALASLEPHRGMLTPGEISILREEKYLLNHKGEVEPKEIFQKPLPSMLFSMTSYAKAHGTTFAPDRGNHGWDAMKKLVRIRNGLMHPKSAAGLSLSDEDLQQVVEAAKWWKSTMLELFATCKEADEFWNSKLNA
ncbi:MAG: hypothetical protein RPU37_00400 [Candidatus Sedimenticola sp. (ex Thyasira tokunagai)]